MGVKNYVAPRDVEVVFDKPLDVGEFLQKESLTSRSGVGPLSRFIAERIQALLG